MWACVSSAANAGAVVLGRRGCWRSSMRCRSRRARPEGTRSTGARAGTNAAPDQGQARQLEAAAAHRLRPDPAAGLERNDRKSGEGDDKGALNLVGELGMREITGRGRYPGVGDRLTRAMCIAASRHGRSNEPQGKVLAILVSKSEFAGSNLQLVDFQLSCRISPNGSPGWAVRSSRFPRPCCWRSNTVDEALWPFPADRLRQCATAHKQIAFAIYTEIPYGHAQ